MATDKNRDEMNQEPMEDGLAALRRLAELDQAGSSGSQPASPSGGEEAGETIPDWLELLLAKYGEEASMLAGVKVSRSSGAQAADSEVAILLDEMAADAEGKQATDRLATSVDWGEGADIELEEPEEEPASWLDRTAQPGPPVPEIPPDQEMPDWLSELSTSGPEAGTGTQPETPPEAEDEGVPDWLAQLSAATPEGEMQEPPTPAREIELGETAWSGDVELQAPATPEGEAPQGPAPEAEEETPDWLLDLEAASEAPADSGEEIPDWLRELGAAEEVPASESVPEALGQTPTQPEDEVPDWLRELEGGEEATPGEAAPPASEMPEQTPEEPEEEIPDWLRELEAAGEKAASEPTVAEAPPSAPEAEMPGEAFEEPEEEMPDWLRQLETSAETPGLPAAEPTAEMGLMDVEGEPEVPDWLASLQKEESFALEMTEGEVSPEEAQLGELAEEPDWLAQVRSTGEQEVWGVEQEVVDADEEAFPDWLAELRASQAATEEPSPGLEFLEETPEIAGEEAEFAFVEEPPSEPEAEVFEAEPPEAPTPEEEYPLAEEPGALDWLAEIEAAAELEAMTEEEAAESPEEAEIPESEKATVETVRLPEWLALSEEGEGEEAPPPEEVQELEEAPPPEEVLAPADVPDWLLQLKPEEAAPAEGRVEEIPESEDVLAGIPGLLPIAEEEIETEEESIAILRSRLGVPQVADVEGAKLFGEIAAEAPQEVAKKEEAKAEPEPRRRRVVANLVWALVFILLILAIAASLLAVLNRVGDLLGGPQFGEFFGSPRVIDPGPVNTFRAQLTRLPADAIVIVSFDYDPATEAEMGPLAQIIVKDLLDHQARVVGVSLRPQGAAMAQAMFEQFDDEYPYGQRTVNLGYLPGQTTGVRSLAFLSSAPLFQGSTETLQGSSAWQNVGGLGDVALIVVLADSPLPVRWWVEQLGPGTRSNRPMIAAVSKAADPSVRPYYNQNDPKSGQLLGLLSGITDAAAYENWLDQPGRAVHSLAAQSVAHLGVVILSLGGTVVGFRTQTARERD